jgi:hypothetical protein
MNEQDEKREWRRSRRLTLGMVVLPPALMTFVLWIPYSSLTLPQYSEILIFLTPLGVGLGCLAAQPISLLDRILIGIVYVPGALFCLFYYAMFAKCVLFGDCP